MSDSAERLDWYRSPIDKRLLAELSTKRDFLPLVFILVQLSFSIVTGGLALWAFHNLSWPWVAGLVTGFYSESGGHQ
jgi:hypothetical protein